MRRRWLTSHRLYFEQRGAQLTRPQPWRHAGKEPFKAPGVVIETVSAARMWATAFKSSPPNGLLTQFFRSDRNRVYGKDSSTFSDSLNLERRAFSIFHFRFDI